MTYKQIKNLKEREFKRLCGVEPKLGSASKNCGIANEIVPTPLP